MRICFLSQSYGPNGTFMVTHSDVVLIIVTHLQYWNYLPTDCPRNYLQTCLQTYLPTYFHTAPRGRNFVSSVMEEFAVPKNPWVSLSRYIDTSEKALLLLLLLIT